MRSLFARILFWFLLATATSSTVIIVAGLLFAQPNLLNTLAGGLLSASLEQAREAYERNGPDGLRRFVTSFERGFTRGVHVTDGAGRDLLTGEDFASHVDATTRVNRPLLIFVNRRALLTRSTADGRYRIFLPVGWNTTGTGLIRPPVMLATLALIGMCWALARHVSRPVVELQHAVERFGDGDTSVRSRSTRADEIGSLARAFDGMADRIEELVQGQRRLLLDISHELRSPLARLTIATDLLRGDRQDEASLAQIEIEAERLNQLIGEILQAARHESSETTRFDAVRLDTLVREIVEACRIEASDGRQLALMMSEGDVSVRGDRELLRRAIENVVRNALRYAPPNTAVDVGLDRLNGLDALDGQNGHLRVTVRDRGTGVPEAALPHLFTPFYRVDTDRERATGGVGLGLAIARRAVELHGGTIRARNAGPGLEVEIRLTPATPTAAPA